MGIHMQSETPSYVRENLLSSLPTLSSIPSACSTFTRSTPGHDLWHRSHRYSTPKRLSRQSNTPWRVSLSPAMRGTQTHLGCPRRRRTYIITSPAIMVSWTIRSFSGSANLCLCSATAQLSQWLIFICLSRRGFNVRHENRV